MYDRLSKLVLLCYPELLTKFLSGLIMLILALLVDKYLPAISNNGKFLLWALFLSIPSISKNFTTAILYIIEMIVKKDEDIHTRDFVLCIFLCLACLILLVVMLCIAYNHSLVWFIVYILSIVLPAIWSIFIHLSS